MRPPSFAAQRKAWAYPPVDDVGYLSSAELLKASDDDLVVLIQEMWKTRYYGWRNYDNRWREIMGLENTTGAAVLDYGCGVGLESLEYARQGNEIYVADIVPENVQLAERVLKIFGHEVDGSFVIQDRRPYIRELGDGCLNVIHCSGVLHHIPNPVPVVAQMASWLVRGGELRLMLYTDQAWRLATNTDPPEAVTEHPDFWKFVRAMDEVGGYADWYNRARLRNRFGEWFRVLRVEYLTESRNYLGAVLRRL